MVPTETRRLVSAEYIEHEGLLTGHSLGDTEDLITVGIFGDKGLVNRDHLVTKVEQDLSGGVGND